MSRGEGPLTPEDVRDDADRRAKEAFAGYRQLLEIAKKHNLKVEAGDDWEHPFMSCVAEIIRSAVKAEQDACEKRLYDWLIETKRWGPAAAREFSKGVRGRDEAT